MSRPRTAAREKVRTQTRQQLLEAAAVEFAREGYVGANINRISQAAGFAKGTIFNYFRSKRALMLALIDEIAAVHTDFFVQQVELEKDPGRRLEHFFRAGFAFVEHHPAQARVIINVVFGPDDELNARVYEAYAPLFTLIIQDIVGAGIARGDFRPVDPDVTAALLMAIYLGSCSQFDADGKIWIEPSQVVDFVLEGLRQRVGGAVWKGSHMSEIARIARLLEQTFEGKPYYGPSVLGALEHVTADVAARKPRWSAHSIWDIVAHLTAELNYAHAVIAGTAGPWIEGKTTWPAVSDTSEAAWQEAVTNLKKANRALVRAVKGLDDTILEEKPIRVRGPFYITLHGTMQHNIYHAGQISLLTGQMTLTEAEEPK